MFVVVLVVSLLLLLQGKLIRRHYNVYQLASIDIDTDINMGPQMRSYWDNILFLCNMVGHYRTEGRPVGRCHLINPLLFLQNFFSVIKAALIMNKWRPFVNTGVN